MSRRRGSATALNASEVVAARAMRSSIHSDMGICQALIARHQKSDVQVGLFACGWNPTRREALSSERGKEKIPSVRTPSMDGFSPYYTSAVVLRSVTHLTCI